MIGNGDLGSLGDAGPQALLGLLFSKEAVGPNEAVGVASLAALERDDMHHRITVEGVISANGFEQRVLGIAEIDAVEIGGYLALEVPGVALGPLRSPDTAAVRMIVVDRKSRLEDLLHLDLHGCRFRPLLRSRSGVHQGL